MSYSFRVKFTEGDPVIDQVSGTLPSGEILISGHADNASIQAGITVRDPFGTQLVMAFGQAPVIPSTDPEPSAT